MFRSKLFHGLFAFCTLTVPGLPAQADGLAIGPGDVIEVSVLSHPELSRLYRVRPDGSISMHIVGSVTAAGLTPDGLEAQLERELAEIFEGTASTTVEVAQYRPVIVGGQVMAPGSYPFVTDLDVAGAVALAQGMLGSQAGSEIASEMRVEAEAARYALLRVRLAGRLVERARLLAEREGTAGIVVPDEAHAILGAASRDLTEAQTALRDVRDEQLALRLAAEDATRSLAENEAAAYEDRQKLIRKQLDATLAELATQQKLAERGLALTQRLFDLRVSAAGYQADELEAVAMEAQARKTILDAEAGKKAATVLRSSDLAVAIAEIDAEIVELRTDIDQAQQFVRLFGGPVRAAAMAGGEPIFRIRRRGPEGPTIIEATRDTLLRPGDMLDVALADPLPAGTARDEGQEVR